VGSHYLLSLDDSENNLAKGINASGDDYLTKPVKKAIFNAGILAMVMAMVVQMQA